MQKNTRSFAHKSANSLQQLSKAIRHIDHITYVGLWSEEEKFIREWNFLGFSESQRLHTTRFPATHIALTSGHVKGFPWATMTGLSVSEDYNSPINEFIRRYGNGMQHAAYNIDPSADMEELRKIMTPLGWTFMTPVLTYEDHHRAKLRQMFSAPMGPYGTFVEWIQRLPSPKGEVYGGFDTKNIDDLYEYYHDYSEWLLHRPLSLEIRPTISTSEHVKHRGLHG